MSKNVRGVLFVGDPYDLPCRVSATPTRLWVCTAAMLRSIVALGY